MVQHNLNVVYYTINNTEVRVMDGYVDIDEVIVIETKYQTADELVEADGGKLSHAFANSSS